MKRFKKRRTGKLRLQTDLEFKENEIKKLNDQYNVEMFYSKVRGGKAFAGEQKVRDFKKLKKQMIWKRKRGKN